MSESQFSKPSNNSISHNFETSQEEIFAVEKIKIGRVCRLHEVALSKKSRSLLDVQDRDGKNPHLRHRGTFCVQSTTEFESCQQKSHFFATASIAPTTTSFNVWALSEVMTGFPVCSSISFRAFPAIFPPF